MEEQLIYVDLSELPAGQHPPPGSVLTLTVRPGLQTHHSDVPEPHRPGWLLQGLDTATPQVTLGSGASLAAVYEEHLGTLMAFKPDEGSQLLGCTACCLRVKPASGAQQPQAAER